MKKEVVTKYGIVSEFDEKSVKVDIFGDEHETLNLDRGLLGEMKIEYNDAIKISKRVDGVTIKYIGPKAISRSDRRALREFVKHIYGSIDLEMIRTKFGRS